MIFQSFLITNHWGKQNIVKRKLKQKFDLLFVLFRGTSHLRPFRLSTKNTIYCLGVHATVDGRFTSFSFSCSISFICLFLPYTILGLFMASFVVLYCVSYHFLIFVVNKMYAIIKRHEQIYACYVLISN